MELLSPIILFPRKIILLAIEDTNAHPGSHRISYSQIAYLDYSLLTSDEDPLPLSIMKYYQIPILKMKVYFLNMMIFHTKYTPLFQPRKKSFLLSIV